MNCQNTAGDRIGYICLFLFLFFFWAAAFCQLNDGWQITRQLMWHLPPFPCGQSATRWRCWEVGLGSKIIQDDRADFVHPTQENWLFLHSGLLHTHGPWWFTWSSVAGKTALNRQKPWGGPGSYWGTLDKAGEEEIGQTWLELSIIFLCWRRREKYFELYLGFSGQQKGGTTRTLLWLVSNQQTGRGFQMWVLVSSTKGPGTNDGIRPEAKISVFFHKRYRKCWDLTKLLKYSATSSNLLLLLLPGEQEAN